MILLIASFQNKYLFKFSCLCDTFGKLNKLNISMQGPDKNMLTYQIKLRRSFQSYCCGRKI